MRLLLAILILTNINKGTAIGQIASQSIQKKSKTIARDRESIPNYIEKNYQRILQLKYDIAVDSLNHLLDQSPHNKEVIYYRAWCHFINGEIFKAYEDVNFYLHQPTSNTYFGHILLGEIQFTRLNKYQALEEMDKAILMEPKKSYAYIEKAKIYASTKDSELGLSYISKCIKEFPNENTFYLYRAILLDNPKKAIKDFNIFLASESATDSVNLSLAYFGLGRSYLMSNDPNNALTQTNLGLRIAPESSAGYGLRGEINFIRNHYDSALMDFKKMEEKINDSRYWKMIAIIYEKKGDTRIACGYYSKLCAMFQDKEACAKQRKLGCKQQK